MKMWSVFFLALTVWCAQNPSEWSRYWERGDCEDTERLDFVQQYGLEAATIVRTKTFENLYVSSGHRQLNIQLPEMTLATDCSGSIMRIEATCSCSGDFARIGHVFCAPSSSDLGWLNIRKPEKNPKGIVAPFSLTDTHKPAKFCAYHATEKSFKVIRFLREYTNKLCVFVSAEFPYDNLHSVVINWGNEHPALQNGGRCIFDFKDVCRNTPARRSCGLCTIL